MYNINSCQRIEDDLIINIGNQQNTLVVKGWYLSDNTKVSITDVNNNTISKEQLDLMATGIMNFNESNEALFSQSMNNYNNYNNYIKYGIGNFLSQEESNNSQEAYSLIQNAIAGQLNQNSVSAVTQSDFEVTDSVDNVEEEIISESNTSESTYNSVAVITSGNYEIPNTITTTQDINGDSNLNTLYGNSNNNFIFGGDSDDYLNGCLANNILVGDDVLYGGSGDDDLWGYNGNDVFVFSLDNSPESGQGNEFNDSGEFGHDSVCTFEKGTLFLDDFSIDQLSIEKVNGDLLLNVIDHDSSISLNSYYNSVDKPDFDIKFNNTDGQCYTYNLGNLVSQISAYEEANDVTWESIMKKSRTAASDSGQYELRLAAESILGYQY